MSQREARHAADPWCRAFAHTQHSACAGSLGEAASICARVHASSIAWAPPCAALGAIACAASPISATLPRAHDRDASTPTSGDKIHDGTHSITRRAESPKGELGGCGAVYRCDHDDVEVCAGAHRVVDEMAAARRAKGRPHSLERATRDPSQEQPRARRFGRTMSAPDSRSARCESLE